MGRQPMVCESLSVQFTLMVVDTSLSVCLAMNVCYSLFLFDFYVCNLGFGLAFVVFRMVLVDISLWMQARLAPGA